MDGLLVVRARQIEYEPLRVSPVFHLSPQARAAAVAVRALASGRESTAYSVRCLAVRVRRPQPHDTLTQRPWGEEDVALRVSGQRPSTCSSCSWPRSRCTVVQVPRGLTPPRPGSATGRIAHVVCARRPPGKIQRPTGVGCSLADADRVLPGRGPGKHLRISGAACDVAVNTVP